MGRLFMNLPSTTKQKDKVIIKKDVVLHADKKAKVYFFSTDFLYIAKFL